MIVDVSFPPRDQQQMIDRQAGLCRVCLERIARMNILGDVEPDYR